MDFNIDRPLQFDLNRPLLFTSDRDLAFTPNRDLGFGKRGRIFRGYVCSACEAPAGVLDTECSQCGAVFEKKTQLVAKKAPQAKPASAGTIYCTYCGSRVEPGHAYCGKCGMQIRIRTKRDHEAGVAGPAGGGEIAGYTALKLPAKRQKKNTMDWSETGKDFKDLIEK